MPDTLLVAELSANHNGSIEIAKQTMLAAKEAGADAVKLQTYTADTMTIDCDKPWFRINSGTLWDGDTLYSLYQKAFTPWEWHGELFEYGRSLGLCVFSTPFDTTAVDFLETLKNPVYKIASFEAMDYPLIAYAANKGKPIVISVGMLALEEIAEAVQTCRDAGNNDITLLVCTSEYPAKPEDAQLLKIGDLASKFNVKVGLSDHTMGYAVASAAVALGACMVEKHFIIDRSAGGVDSAFSMEPLEFKQMADTIRVIEKAVAPPNYGRISKGRVFARSLFAVKDISLGEEFTNENVRSIRPSYGLHPRYLPEILGRRASGDIERGTPLSWDVIEKRRYSGNEKGKNDE